MVVVHRVLGFRFVIYTLDHAPAQVHVTGPGQAKFNLHWPDLDVDLPVGGLAAGLFGTHAWMTQALARVAGQSTSAAKSAAARANGAKGGRPRKPASV